MTGGPPAALGSLAKLQTLDLSNNPIRALPEELCRLDALRNLFIKRTGIARLPACLAARVASEALFVGADGSPYAATAR